MQQLSQQLRAQPEGHWQWPSALGFGSVRGCDDVSMQGSSAGQSL